MPFAPLLADALRGLEDLLLGRSITPARSPALRRTIHLLAVLLAMFLSYKAVHNQITETQVLDGPRDNLFDFLTGTAHRPFAYRVLPALLVRFAADGLHLPALIAFAPELLRQKLAGLCLHAATRPLSGCQDVAAYFAVAWAAFTGFLLLTYASAQALFRTPVASLLAVLLAFFVVDAVLLQRLSHLYDFFVLFDVAFLIYCLQRRWMLVYMLALPFAYLTKETLGLWAGVFFVVQLGHLPIRRNLLLLGMQVVVYVLLHAAVAWAFAGNAGAGHEYYLPEQIDFFTGSVTFAILMPLLLAVLLTFHAFPLKHEVLRRTSVVLLPWFVLFMIGGLEREVRVMFEVLPVVILLAFDSLVRWIHPPTAAAGR